MREELECFDLDAEISDSESHKPWPAGKYAKTLVKKNNLRVVLFTMESGSAIKEHQAGGSIIVQVLRGEIRFRTQDREQKLRKGEILMLGPAIAHAVESVGDCAFLLTIS